MRVLPLQWSCLAGLSFLLTSCMMGPNFHSPAVPQVSGYTESPQAEKTTRTLHAGNAGKAQYFVSGQDIPAAWWSLFHSSAMNSLIQAGLAHSPNLLAAKATLQQAEENLTAQIGTSLYPQVTGQLTGQRERFNSASFGSTTPASIFNLYNASVNVSYTLDFFGAARRQVEAMRAEVDYGQYELDAAYLTLTSNIVTTAITVASYQAQIAATEDIIHSQESQLAILKKQLALGGTAGVNVLNQATLVAQTRATLPPLEQSLVQSKHALAVLVGEFPASFQMPNIQLDQLNLPAHLPLSLPSQLVRQRPDIQASEALLHVASANVGVATANLYPQITLSGSYGWQAATVSNLFKNSTSLWNYGGSLLQPVFDGGTLRARKRAAIAGYQIAAAQYEQVVLQAFQNVADTLRALQHDAESLRAQKLAENSARDALHVMYAQYRLGGVSYALVLTAEQQYQQAHIARVQAQAARYSDTAALFQAMGGGWWNVHDGVKG